MPEEESSFKRQNEQLEEGSKAVRRSLDSMKGTVSNFIKAYKEGMEETKGGLAVSYLKDAEDRSFDSEEKRKTHLKLQTAAEEDGSKVRATYHKLRKKGARRKRSHELGIVDSKKAEAGTYGIRFKQGATGIEVDTEKASKPFRRGGREYVMKGGELYHLRETTTGEMEAKKVSYVT